MQMMPQVTVDDVRRDAPRRVFGATLTLSVAVHLGAVALLPNPDRGHRDPPARPLEVVLVAPPVVQKPRRLPEPSPAAPAQRSRAQPRPAPPEPNSAPPQHDILALPESAPSPVTVAAPEPQERQAKAEAVPPAPASAVAAPVPARESVTPARYDAAYLRNPAPRYPISARRSGITGAVDLKVRVTPDGRAADVQVQRSSGSSVLDGSALEAVRNWQFVPERRGQTPVESWLVVPIVFRLENAR